MSDTSSNKVYLFCEIDEDELIRRFDPEDEDVASAYIYYKAIHPVLRAMFGIHVIEVEESSWTTGMIVDEAKARGLEAQS